MKHLVISCLLLFEFFASFSQKKKQPDMFYLWDSAWNNVTKVEAARYFTRVRFVNDTCWQHFNYKIGGPLLTLETYSDRAGKIPHGRFSYMNTSGRIDSIGYIMDGNLHGKWYFFSDSGKVRMTKEYSYGQLLSVWKAPDSLQPKKNSTHPGDVESIFPGVEGSWVRYLIKNMRYPESAVSQRIQGSVIVGFTVDTQGAVQDGFLIKSVEFTLDDEAIRLIRQSPKWTPAMQNGRAVNSYKIQPIQFSLQ